MSLTASRWAWDRQCRSGIAKLVLLYLADCADHEGTCFPSVATIVRYVQHTERAVRLALKQLIEDRHVEQDHRFARNGGCASNLFRLPVTSMDARRAGQDSPDQPCPAPDAPIKRKRRQRPLAAKTQGGGSRKSRRPPSCENAPDLPISAPPPPAKSGSTPPAHRQENPTTLTKGLVPAERKNESDVEVGSSTAHASARASRARRLPVGWHPSEAGVAYAKERDLSRDELEHFRDHHTARGSTMIDWDAAWRTWCRNAVSYRARNPNREKLSVHETIRRKLGGGSFLIPGMEPTL